MKTLIEGQFGHGAIPLNKTHLKINKFLRNKIAKGFDFDWDKGYDVRDTIGPISIKNQGSNYSCGGQAGSYFLEIQRRLQGIKEGALSAKSIYAPIHYPGGGTTVSALMTQVSTEGANKESLVHSGYITGAPLPESLMIDMSWQNPDTINDALNRAGYTPYDIKEDIDEVASIIENYGAIIWEIRGKNNGTWLTANPRPPLKSSPASYFNHFMCCIGAKMINGKKTIIALQSMGEQCGDKGIQNFEEEWFTTRNIIDCFTFIYDTQLIPLDDNNSIWAAIARWFRNQWNVANAIYQIKY